MDKILSKNVVNKYFKHKKELKELFNIQIEEFDKLKNEYKLEYKKYEIGDEVILDDKTLIHGTRISVKELKEVSKNGLIAPEFLGNYNKNKKKPFVVEFWKLEENITLKNFTDKYCGVTIEVKSNNGQILDRIITPINSIENKILELKDYRDYIIYQNQEQRFLPNNYNSNSTMAFIFRENNHTENYLKNDIFNVEFDKKILKQLVPKWFYKKYMLTRNFDNYETGREKAILYGIPANFIEGILVNKNIEKNKSELNMIKELFPKCYICNLEGKVLMK